jgi:hypothetical protein
MNNLPIGACAAGEHARCANADRTCPCPCHREPEGTTQTIQGGQGWAVRPEAAVRAVLATATALQDTHRRGTTDPGPP